MGKEVAGMNVLWGIKDRPPRMKFLKRFSRTSRSLQAAGEWGRETGRASEAKGTGYENVQRPKTPSDRRGIWTEEIVILLSAVLRPAQKGQGKALCVMLRW